MAINKWLSIIWAKAMPMRCCRSYLMIRWAGSWTSTVWTCKCSWYLVLQICRLALRSSHRTHCRQISQCRKHPKGKSIAMGRMCHSKKINKLYWFSNWSKFNKLMSKVPNWSITCLVNTISRVTTTTPKRLTKSSRSTMQTVESWICV